MRQANKLEIRNPKQIQMLKIQKFQTGPKERFLPLVEMTMHDFAHSYNSDFSFAFVSDFDIRASDLSR
jgi:hypothetical protein